MTESTESAERELMENLTSHINSMCPSRWSAPLFCH